MNISQGFTKFRDALFEPSDALTHQLDRHRARLFAKLMFGSFLSMTLPAFGFGLGEKMPLTPYYGALIVMLAAYLLSRGIYYRVGAGLITAGLYAMSIWVIFSASSYSTSFVAITLVWMVIPFLITSMFFSVRTTTITTLLAFVSLLCLPLLIPELEYRFLAPTWAFMFTWAVMHAVFMYHTNKLEKGGRSELEHAYQQLQIEIEQHQRTEERLHIAITGSGGAYWDEVLDPEVNFDEQPGSVFYSAEKKALLGYDPNADFPSTALDWNQHVLPEDQPQREQRQRQHFEGQTKYLDYEYRVRRADGEIRWIHGRSRILRDENGAPLRWVGIDWDITKRKHTEAELLHYRAHLEERVHTRTNELQLHARHFELLNEITHTAISALSFQETLQILADRLGELIGADGCYITLWDEATQTATPGAAYGQFRDSYPSYRPKPDEHTLTDSVLSRRKTLVVENAHDSPYLHPNISANFPGHSLLGLPLISSEANLGAALIAFNQPHTFTPDEIERCEQAAGQIALVISKTRALETERAARQRAETLQKAMRSLSSSLELQALFNIILESLREVVIYDSASVQRLSGDILTIIGGHGFPNLPDLIGVQFDLTSDDNPNVEVIKQRKTIMIENAAENYPAFRREPHDKANIHSWMGVPLIARGEMIGMIALDRTESHSFKATDAEMAETFAAQAAIAIQNAQFFEDIQQHAATLEEKVADRTSELQILVNSMVGREVRMADLKEVIVKLRRQLLSAEIEPIADDPLKTGLKFKG
ncbi:MAG: GAF domain-containing protein [Chloroflexi bacterium]|jgi:GAF domain-containing protein/PAS domain-containing protein|nr:GAF domain-containing protein [Chloroflexota bacterium]